MNDLIATHGDDSPSGENLEYDADFTALELAARPEQERQAGSEIIAGEEPDFKAVADAARRVLSRSHDLRAAVYLANAELRLNGLLGFAEVTEFLRFCLDEHWDTCHPQLDEDDDNDPTMRVNAVLGLADPEGVLRSLREWAWLTNSRAFGMLTLRDIEMSEGEADPRDGETAMSASEVAAAFQDTAEDELLGFYTAAEAALGHIETVDGVFSEKTPGQGPSLDALIKMLRRIVGILAKAAGVGAETASSDGDTANAGGGAAGEGGGSATGGGIPGQIGSRQDVIAALDKIIDYYNRNEPSSPLPVLLLRARKLVGADFLTIVSDMAPLGVENVHLVGGIVEE